MVKERKHAKGRKEWMSEKNEIAKKENQVVILIMYVINY